MRTVLAALPARRPYPAAYAAPLAVPFASADQNPTDVRSLDTRPSLRDASSPTNITTNSDSSLTAAQTSQPVTFAAASAHAAFDAETPGVVATNGRKRSNARYFVAAEEALKYTSSLQRRKRFTCDCNSVFVASGVDALQGARGLVHANDVLLSNL